jgi:endonuclease/exonuclease/phosphatase (EEP) superfamily protein YafD
VRTWEAASLAGGRRRSGTASATLSPVPVRALVVWPFVAVGLAWVVVRGFGLERGFPMVPLLAYTPLVAGVAVAVALLAAVLRQWLAAGAAALIAVVLVAFVAPRALGGPSGAEGGSGPRLRVLTANLYQQPATAATVVELVREHRVDVLSLQEVTPEVQRALERAGLRERLPRRLADPRGGGVGAALYSRLRLDRRSPLPGTSAPVVAAVRVRGAPPVELYAVHPRAPLRAENMDAWKAGLRTLPAATPGSAVLILAGDFNATLDHAELRRILDRGYEDAADELGAGLRATWPAGRRVPPPVTIDHVLADARCGWREARVLKVPRSDHRAVLAEIELPRAP